MTKEPETLTISEIQKQAMQVLGGRSLSEMYDYVCALEHKYLIGKINSQNSKEEKP